MSSFHAAIASRAQTIVIERRDRGSLLRRLLIPLLFARSCC